MSEIGAGPAAAAGAIGALAAAKGAKWVALKSRAKKECAPHKSNAPKYKECVKASMKKPS